MDEINSSSFLSLRQSIYSWYRDVITPSLHLAPRHEHRKGKTMGSTGEKRGPSVSTKMGGGGETTHEPEVVKLSLKGDALLTNPRWNKVRLFFPFVHIIFTHHPTRNALS
jgi:hypothetical protein